MTKFRSSPILLALGLVQFASAGDAEEKSGWSVGLTSFPCSEIVKFEDNEEIMRLVTQWTYGMWTGWNFANDVQGQLQKNVLDPSADDAALRARVVAACYERPDQVLFEIAFDFFMELPDLAK